MKFNPVIEKLLIEQSSESFATSLLSSANNKLSAWSLSIFYTLKHADLNLLEFIFDFCFFKNI